MVTTIMKADRLMVHLRLDRELVRVVQHCAVDWDVSRDKAFERLVKAGLLSEGTGGARYTELPASGSSSSTNMAQYLDGRC